MPGDDAWLPPVELTPSGRPVLLPDEVERLFISSIDLEAEENPTLTALRSGFLSLTSHRLIWINDVSRFARSIPLDSVIYAFPPNKKSIKNMFGSPRVRIQVSANGDGKVVGGRGTASLVLTIVMRGGKSDSEAFYGKLWEVLKSKSWEVKEVKQRENAGEIRVYGSGEGPSRARVAMVGVAGILRKEQEMWESTDKSLHDAFQDLSALMSKAKEMVALAEKMRQKLLSGSIVQTNTDEEMGSKQEMQDWLLSVGVISPVTKESAGALYHQQLSRQLADFVKLPLDKAGGMIALVDVYCLFNRARGTELISPEDLLQACALWEKYEVPVMLRKFYSGLMVIQSKAQSDEEVFAKISSLAEKPETLKVGISPSDAALTLGIAPALAKEHLLNAESKGLLCRDVSPDGFRFYANLFKEIEPRNIYLVKDHGLYNAWICAASSALA